MVVAVIAARGDIIPTLGSVTAEGSDFRWNYTTNVTIDQMVLTGDYFTIYDFGNLVPGSNQQPAGWTFSSLLVGVTAPTVLPQDDAGIFNLTWTYSGTTPINGAAFLGTFSVVSSTNQLSTDFFTGHATRSTGSTAGSKIDNIGLISVPVPEMSALAPIIGICGLGIVGYFGSLLRRRTN